MSKYTTMVRYICEEAAGLNESVGFAEVDQVLDDSWDKIFTSPVTFFQAEHKEEVCKKILKHYYLREIGAETVGIWKLWMNTRLEEIMPYYNELYSTAANQFNYLNDVDYVKITNEETRDSFNKSGNEQRITNTSESSQRDISDRFQDADQVAKSGTRDADNTYVSDKNGNNLDQYSDTPEGGIENIFPDENGMKYLTNLRNIDTKDHGEDEEIIDEESTENTTRNRSTNKIVDDDVSKTGSNTTSGNTSETGQNSGVTEGRETVSGKMGSISRSKLLQEYRETILNIDMMIVERFNDLFMGLW